MESTQQYNKVHTGQYTTLHNESTQQYNMLHTGQYTMLHNGKYTTVQ